MEFLIYQEINLNRVNPVYRYDQPLEFGDAGAHLWCVAIREEGKVADLTGMSAKCYVTRAASAAEKAQGVASVTVIMNAIVNAAQGTVSCLFDDGCYVGVGAAKCVMRVYNAKGGVMAAARMTAVLERNTSDVLHDPEGIVPSIDALLAHIEMMEAATKAANDAATAANVASDRVNRMQIDATGLAGDANRLGGKAPEYYLQPRNLLDNSWWQNPSEIINQRGYASGGEVLRYGYFIDRWKNSSAETTSYEMSEQGLVISGDAGIRQDIVGVKNGTICTASVKCGDDIVCVTRSVEYNADGTYKSLGSATNGKVRIWMITQFGYLGVMISRETNADSVKAKWAALYEGTYTADTLPPYVPKGYAVELAECQRRYHAYETESARPSKPLDCCPPMELSTGTTALSQGTLTVDGKTLYYNSTDL